MDKPLDVFGRQHEWRSLSDFAEAEHPGTRMGLVYGRRRQGKTYLLEALIEASKGFSFTALEQSKTQNLERLAAQYQAFVGSVAPIRFTDWEEALTALLALGENAKNPFLIVIDEFPYLLDGSPELPSLLQMLLRPRSKAMRMWRSRLILCGSALSTMQGLLSGTAPLRGRASLELFVHPFDYRDAAAFWKVDHQPEMAMKLHALVGGTAAYRDMCGVSIPRAAKDFETWVVDALLDPASAMFREGNVLVSNEGRIVDAAVHFAVLAAVSQGKTRRGEIAAAIGKAEGALAHPLKVLTEARLLATLDDALKQKRTTYHVAEPILRLHQLVTAPNEARLSRHHGKAVWNGLADTVSSKIYGPHFEHLARVWCSDYALPETLGGTASRVGPTEISCREHRKNHEIDVVVLGRTSGESEKIIAIGEAKWKNASCDLDQLHRLEHLRMLLPVASEAKLILFSRSGFERGLEREAKKRADIELVDLDRLYQGT